MRRYNNSKHRDRTLEVVKRSERHLSAEEIYEKMRPDFPKVSLGTIYRNLAVLEDQGRIWKLQFFSDHDRFDGRTDPHYHFLCERCRKVFDLNTPVDSALNERISRETEHAAERHQIEFYGTCKACQAS